MERHYFDVACRRIDDAHRQGGLFLEVGAGDTTAQRDMLLPANSDCTDASRLSSGKE